MNIALRIVAAVILFSVPLGDPYNALSSEEKVLLKPAIERWTRDQIKHNWADLWEIQDQTSEVKNELLLGQRDAPDMNRARYVQAMRETMGTGFPEINAFS